MGILQDKGSSIPLVTLLGGGGCQLPRVEKAPHIYKRLADMLLLGLYLVLYHEDYVFYLEWDIFLDIGRPNVYIIMNSPSYPESH